MKNKMILITLIGACIAMSACSVGGTETVETSESSNTMTKQQTESREQTQSTQQSSKQTTETQSENGQTQEADAVAPVLPGLEFEKKVDIEYSNYFNIYDYKGGYSYIEVKAHAKVDDLERYLIVPEDKEAPEGLDEKITVLKRPFNNIYLLASSAVTLFDNIDEFDSIRFTNSKADGYTNEKIIKALDDGSVIFAGKYSEPDYETLIDEGCDLAIETTRGYAAPDAIDMLRELEIPVIFDWSTLENHPLGRVEWIKFYGALFDKEEAADEFFQSKVAEAAQYTAREKNGKKIAFFYVSSDGHIVVRRTSDYMVKMIDMAGGTYVPEDMSDLDQGISTVALNVERFYADAKDADYLVYNASVNAAITSVSELIDKERSFEDFKAVKEGNVWTTDKSIMDATDRTTDMIKDFSLLMENGDESAMSFLHKVGD